MRKFLFALCAVISAIAFNAVAGATVLGMIGLSPTVGAVMGNVVSLVAGGFMGGGILPAGVFTEVWTGEMIRAFRTAVESIGWYDRIKSYDQYVNNDVIHFVELGGDPEVLINNTTYPISVKTLTDADKPVSLDRYDTEATAVTDAELYACSYDKMASVQERHKEALKEKIWQKAIHAIAPAIHATTSPVLKTTGASDGNRKKMTFADLLSAKKACDKMKMPQKDRILVLCSTHVADLLETEQRFREHYNINQTEGKIGRLFGFDIYEYDNTPSYTVSSLKKLAFGAVAADTDRQASVFYYNGRMMKANGSVMFYHSEAKNDTQYHRNLVNFSKYNICMPLSDKNCTGAIVSDVA